MTTTARTRSQADFAAEGPAHLGARRKLWDAVLTRLDVLARAVVSSCDARRDAFLAASVDMKDYEQRLKALEDDQQRHSLLAPRRD